MATYIELFNLAGNVALKERIAVGCVIAAEAIRNEVNTTPNNAHRLVWAKRVFESPMTEANRMLPVILAQNAAFTQAQIEGATDAAIQSAVNAAVNIFAVA